MSLGASQSIVDGWSTEIKWSRSAGTYGKHATWYLTPTGRKLSSEVEVARYFGFISSSSSSSTSMGGGQVAGSIVLLGGPQPAALPSHPSNPAITLLAGRDGSSSDSDGLGPSSLSASTSSDTVVTQPAVQRLAERNALKRGGRARVVESTSRLLSDGGSGPDLQETVRMPSLRNLDAMIPSLAGTMPPPHASTTIPTVTIPSRPLPPASMTTRGGTSTDTDVDTKSSTSNTQPAKVSGAKRSAASSWLPRGGAAEGAAKPPLILLPAALSIRPGGRLASPGRIREFSDPDPESEAEDSGDDADDPLASSLLRPVAAEERQYAQSQMGRARRVLGARARKIGSAPLRTDMPAAGLHGREEQAELLGLFREARDAVKEAQRAWGEDLEDIDANDDDDEESDDAEDNMLW